MYTLAVGHLVRRWAARRSVRWAAAAVLGAGLAAVLVALIPGVSAFGAAGHTAHLTIVAGKTDAGGGFNFNGYAQGAMTVTVPVGWKVVVTFENAAVLAHSLEVQPFTAVQPPVPQTKPVFAGAATKDLALGLSKGAKTTVSFTADKAGTYEFTCAVPGHASAGMWDKLIVSASAKTPSVTPDGAAKVAALSVK